MSRRDLKIREFVAQNKIKVTYVPTTENQADLMTKHLRSDVFWRHAYTVLGKRVDASNTIDIHHDRFGHKKLVDTMWQMSTPKKKADMPKTRQVFVGRTLSKSRGLAYVAAPRAFYGLVDAVYGALESVPCLWIAGIGTDLASARPP